MDNSNAPQIPQLEPPQDPLTRPAVDVKVPAAEAGDHENHDAGEVPSASPPAASGSHSLTAPVSQYKSPSALAVIESARSNRADSVYDVTPPDMDVMVDEEDSAFDSAIGDMSQAGSTASLTSTIFEYVEENGRTYHRYSDGNLQNHLWGLTLNDRLYISPIDTQKMHRVLDIGCGTGIWTINFADKYPGTTIIGTDLSPVQPKWSVVTPIRSDLMKQTQLTDIKCCTRVPPNCNFEIADAEHDWTYSQPFDFIHGRMLFTCFTVESAKAVFTSAFDNLNPGGYFELQDCIFPQKCIDASSMGTSLSLWNSLCLEASEKTGRPWNTVQYWNSWLREIGFEDVREEVFLWPINTWPRDKGLKELGMWFREDVLSVLPATGRLLTKGLGWSSEEVEVLLAGVRDDVKDRRVHMFEEVRVLYGRKPLSA
ncbi:hypothetical protein BP6252_11821 [Coleophoma cylindrospora]|uniref:S-adenosyl-L-methionine-dependent methyltransferase n=1 Tax=Coleophoma cylindrospora TaxID=1849047 RepID=A0A3D8QKZ1_9HELO|nr:hypothetical protein BP6252_11821 [Coleophoma cylindrospora]